MEWNLAQSFRFGLGFAKTMTWQGQSPLVQTVTKIYATGKKLTQKAMTALELRFEREIGLEKWFVAIRPQAYQNV